MTFSLQLSFVNCLLKCLLKLITQLPPDTEKKKSTKLNIWMTEKGCFSVNCIFQDFGFSFKFSFDFSKVLMKKCSVYYTDLLCCLFFIPSPLVRPLLISLNCPDLCIKICLLISCEQALLWWNDCVHFVLDNSKSVVNLDFLGFPNIVCKSYWKTKRLTIFSACLGWECQENSLCFGLGYQLGHRSLEISNKGKYTLSKILETLTLIVSTWSTGIIWPDPTISFCPVVLWLILLFLML